MAVGSASAETPSKQFSTASAVALVERIVTQVTALPPQASPEEVALRAESMPRPAVGLLVVSLCRMLQSLVREVEVEREQLLDAQSALTELVQRLQRQDRTWTQQDESLKRQDRVVRELASSNAKLRAELLGCRRRPRTGSSGRVQLSADEAATLAAGRHDWSVREDAQQRLWLVADPGALEAEEAATRGGLLVAGASKPCSRRSDTTAVSGSPVPIARGHGVLGVRGALHSLERKTRQHRAESPLFGGAATAAEQQQDEWATVPSPDTPTGEARPGGAQPAQAQAQAQAMPPDELKLHRPWLERSAQLGIAPGPSAQAAAQDVTVRLQQSPSPSRVRPSRPSSAQPFIRRASCGEQLQPDWHAGGAGRSVNFERPLSAGAPRVPIVCARQPSQGGSQLSQACSSGSFPARKRPNSAATQRSRREF